MRTSGGAGASPRRLRGVTPGLLHPLTTMLLTLLLLCSLVAVESASQPAQRREWSPQIPLESQVTIGVDGIATSRGVGRRRSDGLSITRSIPVDTGITPDAAVDDQAIKFTPAQIDLGRVETCSPQRYYVRVENRGRVSVRLDGADFTHEGFSLATDVRGIRLDPGDKFNVQFVFLPSEGEPNGVDAHLRVLTTSGLFSLPISSSEVVTNRYGVSAIRASVPVGVRFEQSLQFINPLDSTIRITEIYTLDSFIHIDLLNGSNWIGPRWPREADENGELEVPGQYDPQFDYTRRADRGAWDMPAGTTSPLIKVSLQKNTPVGEHFTFIHIAADKRRLLMVPVRITVLKPGIHIEPKELDLGMLTDLHDDMHREVTFTLYNTGVNPIEILELKVLESSLMVSAELRGGSSVIPPHTQVFNALAIQIRVGKETTGNCFASLMLKTNASNSELGQRRLKLYGRVAHGNVAFHLNETRFGVIMPLENILREEYDSEDFNSTPNETCAEQIAEDQDMSAIKLVSNIGGKTLKGIVAGATAFRKLRLWNQFDCPVELQRVWMDSALPGQDEVSVYRFKQGVAPAGSAWPKISLQITPPLRSKPEILAARTYSLMVETNVSRHRIQINIYNGFLNLNSTRGLEGYSVSGYYTSLGPNSTQSCLEVPKGGLVTGSSPRIDGGEATTNVQAVQICRSLVFDLDKVASNRSRTEVVKMTNGNPVPVMLRITALSEDDVVGVSIKADVTRAQPDAFIGGSVSYWNNVVGRNTTGNISNAVRAGDSVVLLPGYQVEFNVTVMAKERLGELTVPVMTVETPTEIFHLHAKLRSVQGTVEPVTPAIVLPSMFPGRTQILHLQYRNTFDHAVRPLMATISSSNLKILSMRVAIAPKQAESVLSVLFSPAESSRCSDAEFLADCWIPLPVPDTEHDQTCEQLSDYGEFVDERDLEALSRRDAFWSSTDNQSTVEAQVHLQTDIINDVAEVTIKAHLERPLVTGSASGSSKNVPNRIDRMEFELTELLGWSHVFVSVRNPSNISILMELTIAEADQTLFYSCDEELNEDEESDGSWNEDLEDLEEDNLGDISSLCLAEWKMLTADALSLRRDKHVDIDVPPFYFRRRIIQVPAGVEAQLGPIYYLPSKVQEVATTVFVRNDLSHIEPVQLLARSGKGTLDLLVDTLPGSGNTRFVPTKRTKENIGGDDPHFGYDGTLRFALTNDDSLTDYTQGADIVLSNTGPFDLIIRSMNVEPVQPWTSDTAPQTSDFVVMLEEFTERNADNGEVVLPPTATARFRVSFCASCFAASVTSWLIVDTSDGVKRIRLHGTITTDAAFSCLRSRMAPPLQAAFHYLRMIAVVVTIISTLYTLLILVYDAWTQDAVPQQLRGLNLATQTEETAKNEEIITSSFDHEDMASPRTVMSISRLLEDMEKTAFAPSARVVTPAVSKFLEQRRKGLSSSIRINQSSGTVNFSEGEKSTTPLVTKANSCENEPAFPSLEVENIPPSNMVSTASLRDGLIAEKTGSALLSTSAVRDASIVFSFLEDRDNRKHSDMLSNESSSESPASSCHSSIVQPDAEDSSHGADFPQLSFGSLQRKVDMGPALPASIDTNSLTTAEGAFEAFKSLSTRWRSEDWQDNLSKPASPSLSGNFSDWNGTLSLNVLGNGLLSSTTSGNQRVETGRLGSRIESGSFVDAAPRLYLKEFAAFTPPTASLSSGMTPKPISKNAPPGFTTADAKPLETRAAFEQLRSSGKTTSSVPTVNNPSDSFGGNSVFASKLPLFGPALPPTNGDRVMLGGIGRIGSGRSKVLRSQDSSEIG